jgi:hypothetical protein
MYVVQLMYVTDRIQKCEREPAPERCGLQERLETPMKLPVGQSKPLPPPVEAVKCEREPAPERRGLPARLERPMKLPVGQTEPLRPPAKAVRCEVRGASASRRWSRAGCRRGR